MNWTLDLLVSSQSLAIEQLTMLPAENSLLVADV